MTDKLDREMQAALEADGEKLRQLTGEDHGPWPTTPTVSPDERVRAIARIIDPVTFAKYDKEAASGRLAANGRLWADVAYGTDCDIAIQQARAITALSASPAVKGVQNNISKDLIRDTLNKAYRDFMATGVGREADEKWDDMAEAVWRLVEWYIEETENRIIDAEFRATDLENKLAASPAVDGEAVALRAEVDLWRTRAAAAVSLLPEDMRLGQLQAAVEDIARLSSDNRADLHRPQSDQRSVVSGAEEGAGKYDDPVWNDGVSHVVSLLAATLGVTDWVAGDGSEDYDDDLAVTLLNILEAKGVYDKETGLFAPVPAVPDGWQPIESAPKDGKDVLLYWPLARCSEVFARVKIGYWSQRCEWAWQDRAFMSYSEEPTHWQPLPRQPSNKEGGGA